MSTKFDTSSLTSLLYPLLVLFFLCPLLLSSSLLRFKTSSFSFLLSSRCIFFIPYSFLSPSIFLPESLPVPLPLKYYTYSIVVCSSPSLSIPSCLLSFPPFLMFNYFLFLFFVRTFHPSDSYSCLLLFGLSIIIRGGGNFHKKRHPFCFRVLKRHRMRG